MPQTRSYFALQLPHGWWILAFDLGLEDDIDGLQYQYFAHVGTNYIKGQDQVILCSHEPTWLLDAYFNEPHPEEEPISTSAKNLKQLMRRHLRGKVAMRIAGDVHNYMRHSVKQKLNDSGLRAGASPVLVVSGGGGAFLHPTHCFPRQIKETGAYYNLDMAYPSEAKSRTISMKNLGQGFRIANWRFDVVIATLYFLMVSSFFPRCRLDHVINAPFFYDGARQFFFEVLQIYTEVWSESVISCLASIFVFFVTYSFADTHYGRHRQLIVAFCHFTAHMFCAISLFLLLEIVVETSLRDEMVGNGYDSFFQSFQLFERRKMPKEHWTSGNVVPVLKVLLRVFDLPENMATTRARICNGSVLRPSFWGMNLGSQLKDAAVQICKSGFDAVNNNEIFVEQLSRFELFTYYFGNFLYLHIIAADIASFVLGLYLYICVNVMHWHWNEAFSSIRSPDFKSFCRFHIDSSGDLHVYVIGIDRVPRKWREDMNWVSSWTRLLAAHFNDKNAEIDELDPSIASFGAKRPSRWIAQPTRIRKLRKKQEPYIVDHFVIPCKASKASNQSSSILPEDWWNVFQYLEQRKVFKRTSSATDTQTRRVRQHSYSTSYNSLMGAQKGN